MKKVKTRTTGFSNKRGQSTQTSPITSLLCSGCVIRDASIHPAVAVDIVNIDLFFMPDPSNEPSTYAHGRQNIKRKGSLTNQRLNEFAMINRRKSNFKISQMHENGVRCEVMGKIGSKSYLKPNEKKKLRKGKKSCENKIGTVLQNNN